MYHLRWNWDPAPRLHYFILTAPPYSLHPLASLINNWLNSFHTQEPHWVLLSFSTTRDRTGNRSRRVARTHGKEKPREGGTL